MKTITTIAALALLAGCQDNSDPDAAPEPLPTPLEEGETPQASIMRPDLATPTPTAAPVEPLKIAVGFPDGGSEIPEQELEKLRKLVGSVQVKQGGPIELAAHSDSAGSDDANLRASRKRGEAVRDWLIENGIAADRITMVAFGEQNPARPNALPDGSPNEAGRAANRRVEIHVPVQETEPVIEERVPTFAEELVERTSDEPEPASEEAD